MNSNQVLLTGAGFGCGVAVTLILKTASLSPAWVSVPIVLYAFALVFVYLSSERETHRQIETQLKQFVRVGLRGISNPRCTYYAPIWRGRLLQVCDYVPGGTGGGRKFPNHKGIIGRAFRHKETFVENFGNDADYQSRMVSEYSYTVDEVGLRRADRRSYFCYPLIDDEFRVRGLIYVDSDTFGAFAAVGTDPVAALIRDWCAPIRESICG
jgi:hypothetical protein